ncbi:MAG: hypothetical protein KF787_00825 [Phycisphaeraceae bacterium]|nr:hypothetical protein [Phycisphaerae bacterium]MBX3391165.1 hypothetical protein [Phycisphaeraceae bacterium]
MNHRADIMRQERKSLFDEFGIDGHDSLPFMSSLTLTKCADTAQPKMNRWLHEFLSDAPTEHRSDSPRCLIDPVAAPAHPDHLTAKSLQLCRAELFDQRVAVEPSQHLQGPLDWVE